MIWIVRPLFLVSCVLAVFAAISMTGIFGSYTYTYSYIFAAFICFTCLVVSLWENVIRDIPSITNAQSGWVLMVATGPAKLPAEINQVLVTVGALMLSFFFVKFIRFKMP